MLDDTTRRPDSPKSLSFRRLALSILMPVFLLGVGWYVFMRPFEERKHLVETGIHVPGKLIAVEETGALINRSPELALTIEYRRRDGVLDTGVTNFVPMRRLIGLYRPGVAVTASYDQANPKHVALVSVDAAAAGAPDSVAVATPLHTDEGIPDSTAAMLDSLRNTAQTLRRLADSLTKSMPK